jgi:DnaJ-domain-containing protein 1
VSGDPKSANGQGPPVLQRVPAAPPGAPAAKPPPGAPAARPPPGAPAAIPVPGPSHGLQAREVTVASAIAAGLPAAGSLNDKGALHLHYLAAATQASGRLVLEIDGAIWALTYRRGVVEHAFSNREKEDLAEFLVGRGLLGAEQAADARHLAPTFGGDVLGALVELRLLDPAARFQELKEHGAGLVWKTLLAERGTWRWEPGVPPPPFGFPMGHRWGLLADAVRRIEPGAVRARLGVRGALAVARGHGRVHLPDLMLNPQEARAAAHIDGVRSLEELCAAFPGDAEALRRVVLLLAETELVTFGAPRIGVEKPAPTPPPPAPKAPAPKAPGPAPASKPAPPATKPAPVATKPAPSAAPTLDSLRAEADRLRGADHFQVLGVTREADGSRIKAAYFQLARTFHPDAARDGEDQEARTLRATIFARVAAAWAALENDAARAAYTEELRTGGGAQVDIGRIYQAEQAFERVLSLAGGRAYAEALQKVNEAIALYDQEPEYHVWKGWLEFLLAPEAKRRSQRAASEKVIEAALERSPKCVAGWLFLGRMAKITTDLPAAERFWKHGLEQVNDPELERELRFLKR